jgi:quercetin dioxygenase-like cupin family protein
LHSVGGHDSDSGAVAQSAQPVLKLPNEIEFKAPVSPGTQNAVLYGDPTKAGVYVQRTKFPPGTKVMPHWHPDEWRTAVVLSGMLYFGVGEQWDESKLKAYPAGTFYSEPPKTPHFVWAKDDEVSGTNRHDPDTTKAIRSCNQIRPSYSRARCAIFLPP